MLVQVGCGPPYGLLQGKCPELTEPPPKEVSTTIECALASRRAASVCTAAATHSNTVRVHICRAVMAPAVSVTLHAAGPARS